MQLSTATLLSSLFGLLSEVLHLGLSYLAVSHYFASFASMTRTSLRGALLLALVTTGSRSTATSTSLCANSLCGTSWTVSEETLRG